MASWWGTPSFWAEATRSCMEVAEDKNTMEVTETVTLNKSNAPKKRP